jgi:hypothetical protein
MFRTNYVCIWKPVNLSFQIYLLNLNYKYLALCSHGHTRRGTGAVRGYAMAMLF